MYGKTQMTWTTGHYEYIYESKTQISLSLIHKMEVVSLYSKAAAIGLAVMWAPITIP